jgi:anthranilate phosphoribosyltransferase
VLQGRGSGPQAAVVALNAALVLWAAGLVDTIAAGYGRAAATLAAGEAWTRLEQLRHLLQPPAGG